MTHSHPPQQSGEPKSGFYDYTRSVLQHNLESANTVSNVSQSSVSRIRSYPLYHKSPFIVFVKEKTSPLAHITIAKRMSETIKISVKSLTRVSSVIENSSRVDFCKSGKRSFDGSGFGWILFVFNG
jgi:hypothetical protein